MKLSDLASLNLESYEELSLVARDLDFFLERDWPNLKILKFVTNLYPEEIERFNKKNLPKLKRRAIFKVR